MATTKNEKLNFFIYNHIKNQEDSRNQLSRKGGRQLESSFYLPIESLELRFKAYKSHKEGMLCQKERKAVNMSILALIDRLVCLGRAGNLKKEGGRLKWSTQSDGETRSTL